jgi:hypothetical protein
VTDPPAIKGYATSTVQKGRYGKAVKYLEGLVALPGRDENITVLETKHQTAYIVSSLFQAGEFVRKHATTLVRIIEDRRNAVGSADLEELQLATWLIGQVWPSMSMDRDPFKGPLFVRCIDFFCLDAVSQVRGKCY